MPDRLIALSALLLAAAAALAHAQQPTATGPAAVPPGGARPTTRPASQPASQNFTLTPVAMSIPVPDGPVVKKTELEDGLLAEDLKIGDGYEVKPGGAVVAHYHGTLKDGGKVFDSSFQRGTPVPFSLSGVIVGWQKGVPGMKVGGIRRLTIPSKLAYGERGYAGTIPPNADLVFIIQVVDALQIEDLKPGSGDAATGQFVAVTTHVMKDKDGKEVDKADAAHPYIWIPGEFQGIQFGLEGMKPGGKRHIIVPKEMNNAPPTGATTRPTNVPLTIDVELIAVRNLGGLRRR